MHARHRPGELHLDEGGHFSQVLAAWPGGRFMTDAWRDEPALLVRVRMFKYHWFVPAVRDSFPSLVPHEGPAGVYQLVAVVPPFVAELLSWVSVDDACLGVDLAGLEPSAHLPVGVSASPELAGIDRRSLLEAVDVALARGGDGMQFGDLVHTLDRLAGIASRAGVDLVAVLQFVDDVDGADTVVIDDMFSVASV